MRTKNLCSMVILDALLACGGAYHSPSVPQCGFAFSKTENHQYVKEGRFCFSRDEAQGFQGYIDFVEHTLTDAKSGEKIFFDKPVRM